MRWGTVLVLALALVVNRLATALPLGGRSTVELSALYPNLIVPAGVTFSIWGIIYLAVLIWTGVQFLPGRAPLARAVALPFILTSVFNASWLVLWHYQWVTMSLLVMGALLVTLVVLQGILKESGFGADALPGVRVARWAFGMYTGWVLVATVVNITVYFVYLGWSGTGGWDRLLALALIPVAAALGGFLITVFRNPWIGSTVAWALGGVALNRWGDYPEIAWTAIVFGALVAGYALLYRFIPRGDVRALAPQAA
jgi:translocator protein